MNELKELFKTIKMDELFQAKLSGSHTMITGHVLSKSVDMSGKECKKMDRLDLLYQAMQKVSKFKTFKDIVNALPAMLETLIYFDKLAIIVPDMKFFNTLGFKEDNTTNEHGLSVGRMYHNGMWLKILTARTHPCSKPMFRNLNQLLLGRKRYIIEPNVVTR